mmetsp:Transcript_14325/g.35473  ORF Transcript_14325/g.35473 Transcript_14325/m.35473 type:complete len:206 (+) Transcript_14325:521-1138(+)
MLTPHAMPNPTSMQHATMKGARTCKQLLNRNQPTDLNQPPACMGPSWLQITRSQYEATCSCCTNNSVQILKCQGGKVATLVNACFSSRKLVEQDSLCLGSGDGGSSSDLGLDSCLGSGQARDGHAQGRAGHIVQAHLVEELDGLRVAAVLAADAQLEVGARGAAALRRDLDELAHAGLVQGLEGVAGQQAVLGVEGQELGLGVIA